LTLFEWALVGATFSGYNSKAGGYAGYKTLVFVNFHAVTTAMETTTELRRRLSSDEIEITDLDVPFNEDIIIGGPNSFIGAIRKIDIFSPGAALQARKA